MWSQSLWMPSNLSHRISNSCKWSSNSCKRSSNSCKWNPIHVKALPIRTHALPIHVWAFPICAEVFQAMYMVFQVMYTVFQVMSTLFQPTYMLFQVLQRSSNSSVYSSSCHADAFKKRQLFPNPLCVVLLAGFNFIGPLIKSTFSKDACPSQVSLKKQRQRIA